MSAPTRPTPGPRPDTGAGRPSVTGRDELVAGLVVGGMLALVGALLGFAWSRWSPPGPQAEIVRPGAFAVLGESESQIAADGRFLVIVSAIGLIAALFAWFGLRQFRGPLMISLLCVGAFAGGLLTDLVGRLTGGGSDTGRFYELTDGTRARVTLRLPLSVHMHGLLAVEPAVVALVLGLLVVCCARDDLGRADPVREAALAERMRWPEPAYEDSVVPGGQPQDRWGHGDAAGPAQQGEFSP